MSSSYERLALLYVPANQAMSDTQKLVAIASKLQHVQSTPPTLDTGIDVILVGDAIAQELIAEVTRMEGVGKVIVNDDERHAHHLTVAAADTLKHSMAGYRYLLALSTQHAQSVLPRVAAQLGVGMLSDVCELIREDIFVRPMYAGNVLATVKSSDPQLIMTLRASAFEDQVSHNTCHNDQQEIEHVDKPTSRSAADLATSWQGHAVKVTTRPELSSAEIVVSGGRGFAQAEHFSLLEQLADKLGAAIGASRAAVDAGFIGNDHQVGQTGKIVAPKLYIAVGISGAIQHVAGIKSAKTIIAINRDSDAAIFEVADVGYVGDLFDVLPELIDKL